MNGDEDQTDVNPFEGLDIFGLNKLDYGTVIEPDSDNFNFNPHQDLVETIFKEIQLSKPIFISKLLKRVLNSNKEVYDSVLDSLTALCESPIPFGYCWSSPYLVEEEISEKDELNDEMYIYKMNINQTADLLIGLYSENIESIKELKIVKCMENEITQVIYKTKNLPKFWFKSIKDNKNLEGIYITMNGFPIRYGCFDNFCIEIISNERLDLNNYKFISSIFKHKFIKIFDIDFDILLDHKNFIRFKKGGIINLFHPNKIDEYEKDTIDPELKKLIDDGVDEMEKRERISNTSL